MMSLRVLRVAVVVVGGGLVGRGIAQLEPIREEKVLDLSGGSLRSEFVRCHELPLHPQQP
jgi:hypothetical protein